MRLLTSLILFSVTGFAAKQVEIRKFRFNRHSSANFERLVLEFGSKESELPEVKVTPTASGKDVMINIEATSLVGAIPESSINESFTPKSHWIGPISINSDTPKGGFSVRAFLKNPGAQVDAFWLEAPSRLIVDVFPKESLRASVGRSVLATTASTHKTPARKIASVPTPSPSKDRSVLCFPAQAEVKAKIGFRKYQGSNQVGVTVNTGEDRSTNEEEAIVCYPASMRVNPTVTFSSNDYQATKHLPATHSALPTTNAHTAQVITLAPAPKVEETPLTADERLNHEADLALGLPEPKKEIVAKKPVTPEKRSVASEGMLVPFQDNFNKNNPPPTLGKRLLPPGSLTPNGAGKAPQTASPRGLLPPVH